jgi:hypothetical protein
MEASDPAIGKRWRGGVVRPSPAMTRRREPTSAKQSSIKEMMWSQRAALLVGLVMP